MVYRPYDEDLDDPDNVGAVAAYVAIEGRVVDVTVPTGLLHHSTAAGKPTVPAVVRRVVGAFEVREA